MLAATLYGGAIGAVMGLTGAGGGVLAVPTLMLGLGLSLPQAVPLALVAVASAAALGCIDELRRGMVRYRAALFMACIGALIAPAGLWLSQRLPMPILLGLFCAVMVLVGCRMLWQSLAPHAHTPTSTPRCTLNPQTGRFLWNARCTSTLAATGATAGLFTGLLGVGGGFVIVPALRQFSDLSMQSIAATSLAVIALVSTTTVIGAFSSGAALPSFGWAFILGTIAGLLAGRSVAHHLSGTWLQRVFAVSVLGIAALLFFKHFT